VLLIIHQLESFALL